MLKREEGLVPTSFAQQQQPARGKTETMYDEIYLRGYGEETVDNEQENENAIDGWAFCAEPKTEPKEIVLFGDEDHWDEQHQECPVCHVNLGEQHETWCSYQDE